MQPQPQPHLYFDTGRRWSNLHGNVNCKPERYYDAWNIWNDSSVPATETWRAGLAALQGMVTAAENAGKRVRAVGGGWSLSPAAVTDDFMINTRPLNVMQIGLRRESCDAAFAGACDRLVFAQCGTAVLELNNALEGRQLSLPTSGASNGQTIAGALSTGTHGAAVRVGSIQDYMLGLHLIAERGDHYWVERASAPAVSESFCARLGATLIRDNDLFDAAAVSFGSFGLIHAVLFEAVPIYLLDKHIIRRDYASVEPALDSLDFGALDLPEPDEPYHFEVVVNPYGTGRGEGGAYLRVMYKEPYGAAPPPRNQVVHTGPGNDILCAVNELTDLVPAAIPGAVSALLKGQTSPARETATPGGIFAGTTLKAGGLSCELGVRQQDTSRAVQAILDVVREHRFAGAISLRFVRPSAAFLAFTKFSPTTCAIELPAAGSNRTRETYERIWNALESRGIPHTYHWGQCQRPSPGRLNQEFGARLDAWLAARRRFLGKLGRWTFSNGLTDAWGLSS